MDLLEILTKRGYQFRQHDEEVGWGWFTPNVVDLSIQRADALKHYGLEGLRRELDETLYRPPWGVWTFPDSDITEVLPRQTHVVLGKDGQATATIVAPPAVPHLQQLAERLQALIREEHGLELPLVDDVSVGLELMTGGNAIIIGGSHENRFALELARRYRTFVVDAELPGADGWIVTTHRGVHASGQSSVQLAGGPAAGEMVLRKLVENLDRQENGVLGVAYVHEVELGTRMRERMPSWEAFRDSLPGKIRQFEGQKVDAPEDIVELSELLAKGLDCGGPEKGIYNSAPVDLAIEAARYYQQTGDRRAVTLFRELMFRITEYYLTIPGGAVYPADLDFRSGILVLHFGRLEHDAIFSDEDRLILVNLLLAMTRSVHEFAYKLWAPDRAGDSRHNHQTFPALSLLYSADYFQRYDLPYLHWWLEYSDAIFHDPVFQHGKHTENSFLYEPFVFEHSAAYSLFRGEGLSRFREGVFEMAVRRQVIATDNFLRHVDYGDCAVSVKPVDSVSAQMLAADHPGVIRWYASEGFARQDSLSFRPIFEYPGLRQLPAGEAPPAGGWECLDLDRHFLSEVSPTFPPEHSFDKLAFRSGWQPRDHYLLLEGVGEKVSHAHHDCNGIVRLNHLGRHWVVSNGYGKRLDIKHAGKAFSARVLGPEDHNVLVLRRAGETVKHQPMAATLQRGQEGELLISTTALIGYGGTNWARTLIVLADRYLLVIDRVQVLDDGIEGAHLEWNCLGQASAIDGGFCLEQQGVSMAITNSAGWKAHTEPMDRSASWKAFLGSDAYPYASFPLTKLVFELPELTAGDVQVSATLLAAGEPDIPYSLNDTNDGLQVRGPHPTLTYEDQDLVCELSDEVATLHVARFPELPEVFS